jgi:predicted neuraminidase
MKSAVTLLTAVFAATSASSAEPAAILTREFIYDTAPFPSCHASTIAEGKGGFVVAFFGGTAEKNPDVCIWLSRREAGQWTVPIEVANGIQPDGKRHPCWNPVLFQPNTGPLLLFYKVGPSPETWWGMLRTSSDGGRTWSAPTRLPDGILGPIKNKPVQLTDGSILCPTSTETNSTPSAWRVRFERTSDLGKTWTTAQPSSPGEPAFDAIQPSILSLGGDKLLALGRSRQKVIFQVASDNGGKTWGAVSGTALPNPSSGTDAVTMKDGRHALIYNHTTKGRTPLNLAISTDARTWQAALVLESDPGEYSYPAIIQSADGLLHVTYTWHRKKVRHVVIDPTKLDPKPIVEGQWPHP